MGERTGLYNYLLVVVLALGFASNFLLLPDPYATSASYASVRIVFKVLAFLLPALFAYYRKTSLRQLFCVLCAFTVTAMVLQWAPFAPPVFVTAAVIGIVSGLSVTVTGSVLFLLPLKSMKQHIILGFALSALVIPVVHLFVDASNEVVKTALSALYLVALLAVVLSAGRARATYPSAAETIRKYGGAKKFKEIILTQQTSAMLMLVIATLLTFILGIFASFSSIGGYLFASSDSTLLIVFLVVFIMYLISLAKPSPTWFNTLFSLLMLACIASLLAVLVLPEFPPVLSSYFNLMTVVAMVPVCVFAIEFAKEQNISPVFVCGTLPMLISISFDAGYLLNLVLYNGLGTGSYDISKVAATSLACIAVIVILLFALISRKAESGQFSENDKTTDGTPQSDSETGDDALIGRLVEEKGLSRREAEVAVMFSQGRSAPYISKHIYVAESTVKSHLKRVYVKLDVHNKQDLLDFINAYR